MQLIKNYIAGELKEPLKKQYLDNIEPATGQVYSQIPNSTSEDLEMAVEAAQKVQPAWAALSLEKRAEILMKVADAIDDHSNQLAKAEAIDNGKPFSLAKTVDIYRASANIRFFAQAITQFSSESHAMSDEAINYTLRDPIGVVGCISPWNLPLYLFTWKIAPALASGNAVIAKPSEVTPMTAFLFSKICIEAGLPAGVLNILHGDGPSIGDPLTTHPKIKAISFTGGTSTGAHISKVTAGMFKKLSLELGGKNPTLVFADCDFENTVNSVVRSAFANQGQICLCGSRIYIERPIYEKFKQAFVQKVQALNIGDPLDEDTEHGALVSKPHMEKVLSYIALAKKEGGTVLTGGKQISLEGRCENGYFVEPTVIEGLDNDCRTNQEEIFGPVCTIMPFDSDKEAVELANGTQYGLASSVWTNDLKRAHRVAKQIEAGIVWINCWLLRDLRTPFGGVKNSGVGREGGLEALRFFTEAKNVCIKYN
ncbi:aldehyde dehydrogenase [Kangiella shandongensis]|uniref:aldehyde dehydrogenase n=1 Tax=Kangiella shandongensis TaxID=2763258 RepID=UPI001CC012F6|nr:aldehyde dehydrogenase [Kangiella shandongensis]